MLAAEASAWEAIVAQDSATIHVKDEEDRAALAEREALEKVSRVQLENATALAFAREEVEGFDQKIALPEDRITSEHRAQEVSEREH
jgi:hypothetical protein